MRRTWILLLSLGVLPLAVGCGSGSRGPELVATQGLVKYKGEPLAGAVVTFIPVSDTTNSKIASGTTNEKGEFQLMTGPKKGAVDGAHKVVIVANNPGKSMKTLRDRRPTKKEVDETSIIPRSYSDPKKSGLALEVKKGEPNNFTFELTEDGKGGLVR